MTGKAGHLIGCLLVAGIGLGGPVQALEIVISEHEVEATGVSAGGEVALLSVWRQVNRQGGTEVTLLDELVADQNSDGLVVFEPGAPIPELSIWVAVDIATGETATGSRGSFLPPQAEAQAVGHSGRVELGLSRAVVLWVRPGHGAFRGRLFDGGAGDGDGVVNGRVAVGPPAFDRPAGRPEQIGALGPPSRPPAFAPGDLVVGLDAGTLAVAAVQLQGGGPAGTAQR